MSNQLTVQRTLSLAGKSLSDNLNLALDRAASIDDVIPAAAQSTLTTYGSSSTGSLTVASNPFSTADVVDIYWTVAGANYARHNVVIGTVSGNVCPISGGAGSNIPNSLGLVVGLTKPVTYNLSIAGMIGSATLAAILCQLGQVGRIAFFQSSTQAIIDFPVAGGSYAWSSSLAPSNIADPLTVATITPTALVVSHGSVNSCPFTVLIGGNGG